MTTPSTFLVQIASVPGNQVGHRRFEQNRYLHELLVSTLSSRANESDEKPQIKALTKIIPEHEIVLRSGFSQTAQWGLEPNMFIEIHGDENQARMISALIGEAFCQDGIGIGGSGVEGHSHSVLVINREWENEDERLNLVTNILQQHPTLSAQLDINGQLALHDYSKSAASSFTDIISMIEKTNREYFIEEKQLKSELIDRNDYENLLASIQSSKVHRAFDTLRYAHARLFSGYGCGSLPLPSISTKRKEKRREKRKDPLEKSPRHVGSPAHHCSLIFTSRRPCMCLTDNACFCHYTLILTTHSPSPPS